MGNCSNMSDPAISMHLGTCIDKMVLCVCVLNASRSCRKRTYSPAVENYDQICSAHLCTRSGEATLHGHDEDDGRRACNEPLFPKEKQEKIPGAELILSKQTDSRTGWPAGTNMGRQSRQHDCLSLHNNLTINRSIGQTTNQSSIMY